MAEIESTLLTTASSPDDLQRALGLASRLNTADRLEPNCCQDTEFYVSRTKGAVYVIRGQVHLKLILEYINTAFGSIDLPMTVKEGEYFVLPAKFTREVFDRLAPRAIPTTISLASFEQFEGHYVCGDAHVSTTFATRLVQNPQTGVVRKQVKYPPVVDIDLP
jgi:hypothetical protein